MLNLCPENDCEACPIRRRTEEQVVAHLLERISELEYENMNLRKLEETIQRNIHLFDVVLTASHDAILLANAELTIVRLIHSSLGYREEDLLGKPLLGFVHPDDAHWLEEHCSNLLRCRMEPRTIEMRCLNRDGQWIWQEARVTDMLDDPDVQAIVLNFSPIGKPSMPTSREAD